MKDIVKPVVPYIVASTIALLLVTFIEQISLSGEKSVSQAAYALFTDKLLENAK